MKRLLLGLVAALVLLSVVWLLLGRSGSRHPGEQRAIEALKSLPYTTWTGVRDEDRLKNGVVHHDSERAYQGINLYSSENEPGAFLLDMTGNQILALKDSRPEPRTWKLVKAVGEDEFAALAQDGAILRIDKRSQVLWERQRTFHHDFHIIDDGTLYAIDRRVRRVRELSRLKPVRDDHFVAIAADESLRLDVSSVDLLLSEPELIRLAEEQPRPPLDTEIDLFHTNTIYRIPRNVERDGRVVFHEGDLLICWRNLDTIAVIDPSKASVRWYWGGGEIEWPHHPTLLDNGNLLIFDNGSRRGWSRVLELDPVGREIVWEYKGDPPELFFSSSRGSAQRLPNGNTLITDSMVGRVVEVDRGGEIVWEFFDPRTRKKLFRLERATIYRMTRLPRWPLTPHSPNESGSQ